MEKELYSMGLGEEIHIYGGAWALRVPGGWVFWREAESGTGGWVLTSCFVPFDNEFQSIDRLEDV